MHVKSEYIIYLDLLPAHFGSRKSRLENHIRLPKLRNCGTVLCHEFRKTRFNFITSIRKRQAFLAGFVEWKSVERPWYSSVRLVLLIFVHSNQSIVSASRL